MNDLEYSQLSNPKQSLKLVLMHRRNHRELFLKYFYYLDEGSHRISFFELISSNTKGRRSYLDHIIIFEDFITYIIYHILEILWLGITK